MADFLQMVLHTDIPALIARPALMQPEYAAEASLSLSYAVIFPWRLNWSLLNLCDKKGCYVSVSLQ